jgi:hypothetical protein
MLWKIEKHYFLHYKMIIFTLYKDLYEISYFKLTKYFGLSLKLQKKQFNIMLK